MGATRTRQESGAQSWHWCRRCHAYVELVDPGDAYPQCGKCGSRQMEWREAEPDRRMVAGFTHRKQPQMVSLEAAPIRRVKKHLPAEKRNLVTLAKTGYWFCYADECRQITERNEMGECVCCGAVLEEEKNWNAPVFKDLAGQAEERAA